jgi:hypothetical protein
MDDIEDNAGDQPIQDGSVMPEAAPESVPDMHAEAAAPAAPAKPKPNRRLQTRYLAHWRAALVGEKVKYMGRTDNVSLSGAAVIADVNLRPKQEFRVYLEIPTQPGQPAQIFEAVGTVVHSMLSQGSFKIGIAFTFFVDDSDRMLHAALASGRYKELFDPTFS